MPRKLPRHKGPPHARVRASLRAPVRARTWLREHHWASWSTLAAIAAVLTFVSPYINSLVGLLETTNSAKQREDKITAEYTGDINRLKADVKTDVASIYTEIGKIRLELKQFQDFEARKDAGVNQNLLENRVYVARNKINDCNIAAQNNKKRSPLEIMACDQYLSDYNEAKRRYENAVDSAQLTWRKP
jgi:hypothetical protein